VVVVAVMMNFVVNTKDLAQRWSWW